MNHTHLLITDVRRIVDDLVDTLDRALERTRPDTGFPPAQEENPHGHR